MLPTALYPLGAPCFECLHNRQQRLPCAAHSLSDFDELLDCSSSTTTLTSAQPGFAPLWIKWPDGTTFGSCIGWASAVEVAPISQTAQTNARCRKMRMIRPFARGTMTEPAHVGRAPGGSC